MGVAVGVGERGSNSAASSWRCIERREIPVVPASSASVWRRQTYALKRARRFRDGCGLF